jgi:hypothetical protein
MATNELVLTAKDAKGTPKMGKNSPVLVRSKANKTG